MSMLSAQCDRLRERAKELRDLAPDPTVPYIVPSTKETMALAMHSAASEMGDAADNIWELRCKLNDEQDENDKLRELCEWLLNPYRLGAVTGEGVDRQWCRETYDGGSYRLRELRVEVDE